MTYIIRPTCALLTSTIDAITGVTYSVKEIDGTVVVADTTGGRYTLATDAYYTFFGASVAVPDSFYGGVVIWNNNSTTGEVQISNISNVDIRAAQIQASGIQSSLTAVSGNLDTAQADLDIITGTDGVLLDSTTNVYHADINAVIDDTNSRDEYTVVWFKNGERVTSSITSPTIQVIKRADGTDLIAETSMTQIASTKIYQKNESSNTMSTDEAYIILTNATIDGGARSFAKIVVNDVTS